MNPELVHRAADSMRMRFRYNYSVYDLSYNLLFPFKCFGKYCRKSIYNIHSRYTLFQKGESRLAKELDIISFARTQRKQKILMHSLMDESERYLAPYQKSNAISLLSDSNSSLSDDSAYSEIPKLLWDSKQKRNYVASVNKFLVSIEIFKYFFFKEITQIIFSVLKY